MDNKTNHFPLSTGTRRSSHTSITDRMPDRTRSRKYPAYIIAILFLVLLFPALGNAQALPAPVTCQQFFAANGTPLAGGFLYTFQSGTNVPQATYTDYTQSTPNANPIILNAGGFATSSTGSCGVFLNPSLTYRFVLQNASSSQQWQVDGITASNINTLLSQPNTWTALQTFSGGISTSTLTLQTVVTSQVDNEYYIDGTVYPKTAAGINTADSTLGSNAGVIHITYPGSYCDTTVNLSNGHTLEFSPGLYNINIAGADSNSTNVTWGVVGTGSNQVTLQSCSATNKDVITSQHFSTFTGGTNFYGTYHVKIKGLTLDGNKGSETAGYGIRLYGRSPWPEDVITQNCFNDGQWWEWGGTESDTGLGTSVNGNGVVLESDYNGGNGITFYAAGASPGALNAIGNIVTHNNGGWGFKQYYSISAGQINSYENTSGACDMHLGGLIATNVECDTTTGWGLYQESGAGTVFIASAVLEGGIPFESDTTSGGVIQGLFANPAAASPCIKINGGGSLNIVATGFGCSTEIVSFVSEGTPSFISFNHAGPTTLYSGTPTGHDFLNLIASGGTQYLQLPNATINAAGYAPILPTSNGTLLSSGNTDPHFQYASAGGCTTGGSTGNSCASPTTITWTTPFADTSYTPLCTGLGVTNVPSGPYVVTKSTGSMTVNYFAITGAAASYTTVSCWAVHP